MMMNANAQRRWILLGMILLQSLALWITYRSALVGVVAVGIALLGVRGRFVFRPSQRQYSLLMLALLLPFMVEWQLFPYQPPGAYGLTGHRVTFIFVQYFMALQLLQMFVERPSPSAAVPLIGASAMACAGNLFVALPTDRLFGALCIGFGVLMVAYLRTLLRPAPSTATSGRRSGSRLAAGGMLGLAVLASVALSSALYWNRHALTLSISRPWASRLAADAQFSDEAELGNVNRLRLGPNRDQTALRVFADEAPGYLRAKVFDAYRRSLWTDTAGAETLPPMKRPPTGLEPPVPPKQLFQLIDVESTRWRSLDVWPTASITTGMFMPQETAVLAAPIDSLQQYHHGTVDSGEISGGVNYIAHLPEALPRRTLTADERRRYTQLPDNLDLRIRMLAAALFLGRTDPGAKINAVVSHFHRHYDYHYGIQIPRGRDPVTHFLLHRPAAHCEYFAAGAALLLRLADVPARYVTGFVADEWNPVGGYWMARYRSAHAWVEAWDDTQGRWVLVEATPGSGVPSPEVAAMSDYALDAAKFQMQEVRVRIQLRGVIGFLGWLRERGGALLGWLFGSGPWSLALLAVAAFWVAGRATRRFLQRPPVSHRPTPPEIRQLNALLFRADRVCRTLAPPRRPDETLLRFARRVRAHSQALADWYAAYAAVRYGGEITPGAIDRLQADLPGKPHRAD